MVLLNVLKISKHTVLPKNRTKLHSFHQYFKVDDISNFYSDDPLLWFSQKSGDSSYVPMNTGDNLSVLGKLSFNLFKGDWTRPEYRPGGYGRNCSW